MRGPGARLAALAVAALVLLADPAFLAAQTWSLDTEHTYASRYEWRGLTQDTGSNLQHSVFASVSSDRVIVTTGVWTVADLSPASTGLPERWGSELSPWFEVSYGSESAGAFVGGTAYLFTEDASRGQRSETAEIYAGATGMLPRVPLELETTLFWDVHRVRGGYLETAAALQIPFWNAVLVPVGSLFLEGRMGASLGQERDEGDADVAHYFEQGGFTHVDVALRTTTTPVAFWRIEGSVTLESRWTRGFDPATRRGNESPTQPLDRDRWSWRAGVHLTLPVCRPERELCRDL